MNVKRYYRQYNELITKHERISYKIVLDALKGIFSNASKLYAENPLIPVELLVREQDTLDFLIKIYNSVGIETAKFVDSSLPKQKSSSLILQTKASVKPKQPYKIDNSDKINYWKQEFILFTQSPDCAKKVTKITETTKEQIRQVMNTAVKEQLSHKQIAKLLLDQGGVINTKKRALLIARTENAVGSNKAAMLAAKSSGLVLYKQWIARSGDGKTRDSHAGMVDSSPIPMDEAFNVGDEKMMSPGDSSLGATVKNIANCRCTVAFVPASQVIQQGLNNPEPTKPVVNHNPIQPVIQPKKGFTPAKNLLEAEKFIIDNEISNNVDYIWCKDIDVINEVNRTLFELKEQYGLTQLDTIGGSPKSKSALMSASSKILNINHSIFKSMKSANATYQKFELGYQDILTNNIRIVEKNLVRGVDKYKWTKKLLELKEEQKYSRYTVHYSEKSFIQDTVIHEYGHIMHDQLSGGINGIRGVNKKILDFNGQLNELAKGLNRENYKNYIKARSNGDKYKISAYGNTNEHEFFAETFLMYTKKDPDLPSYIVEYFDRYFALTK